MSDLSQRPFVNLTLPRRMKWKQDSSITAPGHASFTTRFGHAFPKPQYLESDLGITAVYGLPPPSGESKRRVLIIHGVGTPALGMWPVAKELQALDNNAHIVLFDLWGHGLSSTPLAPHAPHIFHYQILQVLGFMRWTDAHIIGYSFGGSTAITFAVQHTWAASSVAVLGPAGLLRKEDFGAKLSELLEDSTGRELEAIQCVLSWLEGGPLVVPVDWKERALSGQVVAEAFREWEQQEHAGHPHSILSMFREGGVSGFEDYFRKFARLPLKKIGVLAELDNVCSQDQLIDFGFDNVQVIKNEDHAFVRSAPSQVAHIIYEFWKQHS